MAVAVAVAVAVATSNGGLSRGRIMHRIFIAFLIAVSSSLVHGAGFDQGIWNGLLKKNVVLVRQGQATQVNYAGMAADRGQLKKYLAATSGVSTAAFNSWGKPEQLAFLINAYNAWTV